MKKIIISLVLITFIMTSFTTSTNVQIAIGPNIEKQFLYEYIGAIDNYVYAYSGTKKESNFVKIKNMKTYEFVPFSSIIKDGRYLYSWIEGNKIYIVYSSNRANSRTRDFFVTELNPETLQPEGKSKKIADFLMEDFVQVEKIWVTHSPDESKNLIGISIIDYNNPKTKPLVFAVFDSDYNLLWNRKTSFTYKSNHKYSSREFISSQAVTNEGIACYNMIVKAKKNQKTDPAVRTKLCIFKKESTKYKTLDVITSKVQPLISKITINQDDKLVCAGYYTTPGNKSFVGAFGIRIDPVTGKQEEVYTKEFAQNFISQDLGAKNKKFLNPKKKDTYDYHNRFLLKKGDGGFVFITEQIFEKSSASPSGGTSTYYYYNDVLVTSFDSNGKPQWNNKVVKRQNHSNPKRFSFSPGVIGNDVYILYNDHIKNRKLAAGVLTKKYATFISATDLMICRLSAKAVEKTFVGNGANTHLQFRPATGYFDKNNHTFYIEGGIKDHFKSAMVEIK